MREGSGPEGDAESEGGPLLQLALEEGRAGHVHLVACIRILSIHN